MATLLILIALTLATFLFFSAKSFYKELQTFEHDEKQLAELMYEIENGQNLTDRKILNPTIGKVYNELIRQELSRRENNKDDYMHTIYLRSLANNLPNLCNSMSKNVLKDTKK